MSVAELFIKRPVMTTLVMIAILLFGVMGYRMLPVSDLPNVDFPTILVSASLPGATPYTMASAVATPLEKQFSTIAGIDSMSSASSLGETLMAQRISMVPGVAQVQVFGTQKYAVRVQVSADALASRGIGLDEVQQ